MSKTRTLLDLSPREATAAREIALRYGNRPDALLEILHDLQEHLGFIPEAALPALAKSLGLSRAEVHGVVTFYHDYRREPAGRHVIKVCRAEACQSMGANELVGMIERYLKVKLGQTTADGAITVEAAYCLGNCALSPAVMVDEKLVGRVDAKKFEKIVAECRS
ncbi:formate dehydrogenase subunit gamma [Aestuariivirga sp.]|uniref:formate dehydrogenase subunit gamma n=1 Tax=Aestuariivirga sp. TaxID=2650926 RepID=UPI0035B49A84